MHAGGDDRQPPFVAFWLDHGLGDDLLKSGVFVRPSTKFFFRFRSNLVCG